MWHPVARPDRPLAVSVTGAVAGAVLVGVGPNNNGLRLRIEMAQSRGHHGPIAGVFRILDAGGDKHSSALEALVGTTTDATEVLRLIRAVSPQCINVVNAGLLAIETEGSPSNREVDC